MSTSFSAGLGEALDGESLFSSSRFVQACILTGLVFGFTAMGAVAYENPSKNTEVQPE